MKPTLNEEIGMSQKAIDYVNSLEVKEPTFPGLDYETAMKAAKSELPDFVKELEQQRIRKEARNAWICIAAIILLTIILNWK